MYQSIWKCRDNLPYKEVSYNGAYGNNGDITTLIVDDSVKNLDYKEKIMIE